MRPQVRSTFRTAQTFPDSKMIKQQWNELIRKATHTQDPMDLGSGHHRNQVIAAPPRIEPLLHRSLTDQTEDLNAFRHVAVLVDQFEDRHLNSVPVWASVVLDRPTCAGPWSLLSSSLVRCWHTA